MMVAVYRCQYGPAVVYTLPLQGEPKRAAVPAMTAGQLARAASQFQAKGSAVTWPEWGDILARQLPYFDSWTVEQVPDGTDPQQALNLVRHREGTALLRG